MKAVALRWRTGLPLFLVAALAAYLFLWDKPRERRHLAARAEAARLFAVDPSAVDTVRLRRPESTTTLARRSDGWWIVSPFQERADGSIVDSLVRTLTQSSRTDLVVATCDSARWADFGVDPHAFGTLLTELVTHEKNRLGLWLGHENPLGTGVYVRRQGNAAIELVDPKLGELSRLTVQSVRRYGLFEIPRDSIQWIEVIRPHEQWSARRNARGLWFTQQEPRRQLRRNQIDLLLYDLTTARIQAFVEDQVAPDRWAGYGLHQPAVELAFTATPDTSCVHRVWIGNESENHGWYARRDTLRSVLQLTGPLLQTAQRPLADLWENNPIPDNYTLLDSLKVQWLAGGECTAVHEKGKWHLRTPANWQGDKGRLETPMTNLATGLEEMQSDSVALLAPGQPPTAIAPVQRIACVLYWPDRTVRFTVGWRSGEENHWLYVDGERELHRVDRGVYFRLYSVLLALNQIPGETETAGDLDGD